MPTVFERLNVALEGSDLSQQVTLQADGLAQVATLVSNLISNPPQSLSDLGRFVDELPLPDLDVGGDISATLSSVRSALPTDLSSLTGGLVAGLDQLEGTIGADLTQVLQNSLQVVLSVYRLTQVDFGCIDGAAAPDGASGSGGGGEPPAGPETAPPGPIEVNTAALTQASATLDQFPSPLNVETFLEWLHQVAAYSARDELFPRALPIVDDLLDPLDTLLSWRSMSSDEVRDHIADTLRDVTAFIQEVVDSTVGNVANDITALDAGLPISQIAQLGLDLATRLAELRAAIQSADISGTGPVVDAINNLLDQYDAILNSFQSGLQAEAVNVRLAVLSDDLEDRMGHVLSILQPSGGLGFLEPLSAGFPPPDISDSLSDLEDWLQSVVDLFQQLSEMLDLSAIQAPLATVAQGARDAVDGLDQGLITLTLEVQSLLGEVETLLDQLDIVAFSTQAQDAINTFRDLVVQQIDALFAPVRQAVGQVVQTISDAVATFDPEQIIAALQQALQTITSVLEDPEVVAAVEQVRTVLDNVTQQLESLSFSPITDEVIEAIEDVSATIRSINPSLIPDALQGALQAALSALPETLDPITDQLVAEFEELVSSGPVPVLETVREQPQRLLDEIRNFEPAELVGDALSAPYQELLSQMEGFQPSSLLAPVEDALDGLKDRLRENANPGLALEALAPLFEELTQAFNALDPNDIVNPLEETITGVVDSLLEALPLDETFQQVDAALGRVEDFVSMGDLLVNFLRRVRDLLAGFADPQTQMEAWLDSILAQVEAISITAEFQVVLQDLSSALDGTQAPAILDRFDSAAQSLQDALNALDPQQRLSALVQAYNGVPRQALNALPDSPEKTAIIGVLDRFNPAQPAFGAPYQVLDDFGQALAQARSSLETVLSDWDERFHGADSALAEFRIVAPVGADIAQWLRDAVLPQFTQPLTSIFAAAEPVQQAVSAIVAQLEQLITSIQGQLTGLLLGPDSLSGIRDSIQGLVQRLQDFNLDFLRDSLDSLFDNVRGKLEAINPAQLRVTVETAFKDMLDALTLEQVLPAADLAQLDADYATVLETLRALDPARLVTEVLQPEFENTVLPFLENFDLTGVLTALIERLQGLDEELKQEMERVNQSYQSLRQAVSAIS